MPSKGSRAASRQAKLRQKKRRGKGGPQIMDTEPTAPRSDSEVAERAEEVAPEPRPRRRETSPSRRTARPSPRAIREAAADQARPSYLGAELRQIGMIAGLIAVILVALTFVLGG